MIIYWLVVVYLGSVVFTPWAIGIMNPWSDDEEEGQQSEFEKYQMQIVEKIMPFVPIFNTGYIVIVLYGIILGNSIYLYLKIRMKYSKGVNKFKIGRKIIEEFGDEG